MKSGPALDWPRLLMRFGDYWRVLLSHIILFGFVYPDKRENVPQWVMDELSAKAQRRPAEPPERHLLRHPALARAVLCTTSIAGSTATPACSRGTDDGRADCDLDGRIAADFVQREQPVVDVEGRVLDALWRRPVRSSAGTCRRSACSSPSSGVANAGSLQQQSLDEVEHEAA